MKNPMDGWTELERKAAEAEAKRQGTTPEDIAKKALEQHRLMSCRGALYRAQIV